MIINSAVILAGGKGTRLKKILNGLPKPLVKINNKSLLDHQIDLLTKYKIFNIYILVNYKSQIIKNHIEKKYQNINIKILDDGENPLGTGGSILHHLNNFPENFFVLYGDTFLDVNLKKFAEFHFKIKSELSLFVHPNSHPYDSDIVICNSKKRVIDISGYPHDKYFYSSNLVNAALYVVNKETLLSVNCFNKKDIVDFAKHVIPDCLINKKKVFAYKSREYIKDCGTVDRLNSVENDFKNNKHTKLSFDSESNIIFLDRDGTLIENIDYLKNINQIKFITGSFDALKRFNKNGNLVAMVTNQPVISRGELNEKELNDIHRYIEWEIGKNGAYIDELEYCPHHPDSGFMGEVKSLKINCDCRKPNTGMLNKIARLNKINQSKSWIIGDSTSDIRCGNNFGIKSVLVNTGLCGSDMKHYCRPDFEFSNLNEASKFIVNKHKKLISKVSKIKLDFKNKNVFISGVSMSGKSTLSSIIKEIVEKKHDVKCHVVCLDDYLLPTEERKNFPNKFDLVEVKRILLLRKNNKTVMFNARRYNKYNRKVKVYKDQIIIINPEDFIIFEGLLFGKISINFFKKNQFYIESNRQKLYKRFNSDYKSRGMSKSEINELYDSRNPERKIIKQQKKYLKTIKL